MRALILAVMIALGVACASAQPHGAPPSAIQQTDLIVVGQAGRSQTLTARDLAAMARTSARVTIHDVTSEFSGVPLTAILARVGAVSGTELRGQALADVVVVTSRDNYQVALSLAETDEALSGRHVFVADRVNGAPIGAEDGPFRLIVVEDMRPARSARMVTTIEVWRSVSTMAGQMGRAAAPQR